MHIKVTSVFQEFERIGLGFAARQAWGQAKVGVS